MKHIKGTANILADSVSRLQAVGLYHDLDFQNSQPELRISFEPLLPMKQAIHIRITVHEIFIKPDVETLAKKLTVAQIEGSNISLEYISPTMQLT